MLAKRGGERAAGKRRPATIQALERGLGILDVLSREGRMPLARIAKLAGLNLSTAHHLMKTLEGRGYVAIGPGRSWELSRRVFQLAAAAWNADDLAALGMPAITALGKKTGESTQLAVFDRKHVILLAKFDGAGPERLFERLGAPRPAYCTALGKVLLAYQPPEAVESYLADTDFTAFTPKTLTSAVRLREELRRVRRAGVGVDDQEFSHGIRCVAAPVFNFTNGVIAAVGMFGPAWRISNGRLSTYAKTVARHARTLSQQLGYGGAYPPALEN